MARLRVTPFSCFFSLSLYSNFQFLKLVLRFFFFLFPFYFSFNFFSLPALASEFKKRCFLRSRNQIPLHQQRQRESLRGGARLKSPPSLEPICRHRPSGASRLGLRLPRLTTAANSMNLARLPTPANSGNVRSVRGPPASRHTLACQTPERNLSFLRHSPSSPAVAHADVRGKWTCRRRRKRQRQAGNQKTRFS